jgi:hypothetical protein
LRASDLLLGNVLSIKAPPGETRWLGVSGSSGLKIESNARWAVQLCDGDGTKNLCEHPEMSGVPAVLLAVVFFVLRGMEL